jgi:hypothetical protein
MIVTLRHGLNRALDSLSPHTAAFAAVLLAALYAVVMAGLKWLPVNDALLFTLVLCAVFALLQRASARTLTLHLVTQILVLSWVLHLWTLGYEGRNAVFGGILPWSDSFDYYDDSLRLLHGNLLEYAAKRPLFSVTLAALLKLCGGDLRLPLLMFAVFSAWAIALAASEIWKTHGSRAALVVYALLLLSERQWAGFVQTEDIGLPLGLIGFVLIWRGVSAKEAGNALLFAAAGLFTLSVALMARAGPFFILPALALWCALKLPGSVTAQRRLQVFALAALAIAAGIGVHLAVLHLAASGSSFSDYPSIAYGLLHGKDFTLLAEQHPELAALGAAARAHAAWQIVIAEALSHPLLTAGRLLQSFADLFVSRAGLFGFVWRNPDDIVLENGAALHAALAQYGLIGPLRLWVGSFGLYSLFNALAMAVLAIAFTGATIYALVALYRRPADGFTWLLRFAVAGVLLSAPFTPPWITSSHQVQTATLAFLAAVPALILFAKPQPALLPPLRLIALPPVFAVALVLALVLMRQNPEPAPFCNRADTHMMMLYPGTAVRVTAERSFVLKDKARADLLFSTQYLKRHNRAYTASLLPYLKEGTLYVAAYDACDQSSKTLVDDHGLIELRNRSWQPLAVRPLAEPRVMHVEAR